MALDTKIVSAALESVRKPEKRICGNSGYHSKVYEITPDLAAREIIIPHPSYQAPGSNLLMTTAVLDHVFGRYLASHGANTAQIHGIIFAPNVQGYEDNPDGAIIQVMDFVPHIPLNELEEEEYAHARNHLKIQREIAREAGIELPRDLSECRNVMYDPRNGIVLSDLSMSKLTSDGPTIKYLLETHPTEIFYEDGTEINWN